MNHENSGSVATSSVAFEQIGNSIAQALIFWEPRRVYYNLALAAVVMIHLMTNMPAAWNAITYDSIFGLFFLAVIANLLYCAAYVVDLFVQPSGLREQWKIGRLILLGIGTLFACVIAHFCMQSFSFVGPE